METKEFKTLMRKLRRLLDKIQSELNRLPDHSLQKANNHARETETLPYCIAQGQKAISNLEADTYFIIGKEQKSKLLTSKKVK